MLACVAGALGLLSEKINGHSRHMNSVAFSPDGNIVSTCTGGMIKVWDADSFNLLDSHPGEAIAFYRDTAEDVYHSVHLVAYSPDGTKIVFVEDSTIRMKDGGGTFYAPSLISCVAVSWPRIAAGAQSGELYHLEVM